MKTTDFDYDLPPELIAQHPLPERAGSRLLHVHDDQLVDRAFADIVQLIRPRDCLVLNNTRVIPARLFGHKATGGKLEILVERIRDSHTMLAHVRASKSPKPGSRILVGEWQLEVLQREDDLFVLAVRDRTIMELLEQQGHMPLPPYIERSDTEADQERYQTVFAAQPGAVAAPTAGLHFDEPLLETIRAQGTAIGQVTLHVGSGTFQPVRVENVADHHMHAEWIEVGEDVVDLINRTRANGGRVIAVGTTVVRSLETAAAEGDIKPYCGDTDIFITPGYRFRIIDALITNFHLPQSTLLMLVCALGGYDNMMAAYQHAIRQRYRFFSYGDAMFIEAKAD